MLDHKDNYADDWRFCDCEDCQESDSPCQCDCYRDATACKGCKEAWMEREEIEFECDCHRGVR